MILSRINESLNLVEAERKLANISITQESPKVDLPQDIKLFSYVPGCEADTSLIGQNNSYTDKQIVNARKMNTPVEDYDEDSLLTHI